MEIVDIKQVITSFLFKKILLLERLFFFLLLSLSNILNTMQIKNFFFFLTKPTVTKLEIAGIPVAPFKAYVRIVNRLPIQESYLLGVKILLSESIPMDVDKNVTVQELSLIHI